ncbi:MAG: ABC transporter ATP-binding protein, partial [Lentisphaeria bacterium]|nr:ABC transporter ATP-binding protein [Lentisphaeria bacterium]
EFQGSVDDYPKWLAEHNRGSTDCDNSLPSESQKPKTNISASEKKEQKRIEAERRAQLQPITNRIKRAERVMEKLSQHKAEIEQQLAEPNLYNDENKEKLKSILTDQAYIQKELDQAEMQWMEASQEYEEKSISTKQDN